jgi:adenosylcobinamide-phosphate synthase
MVSTAIALTIFVLIGALVVDLLVGDPQSRYHPVALLGRFIGIWGRPEYFPPPTQRLAGVVLWFLTAGFFVVPFILFSLWAPGYLYLLLGPVFLKICFAWRSLEEHTIAVKTALADGVENGRDQVKLLVSRDTAALDREHILSAGYESLTENLTDSIISPLLFFVVFGLGGAAVYRAANTMDAMLGYRDERERLGWWSARTDDILNFIPARITVVLLLVYFMLKGRLPNALKIMKRDGHKRPGFNGGIVMAAMAGGIGVKFEKPGVYTIGDGEISLDDGGREIMKATRAVVLFFVGFACCTLFLLGSLINNISI